MTNKNIILSVSILLFIIFCLSVLPDNTEAVENTEELYNQAIKEGVFKQEELSYDKWIKENKEIKESYDEGLIANILDPTLSFAEWL